MSLNTEHDSLRSRSIPSSLILLQFEDISTYLRILFIWNTLEESKDVLYELCFVFAMHWNGPMLPNASSMIKDMYLGCRLPAFVAVGSAANGVHVVTALATFLFSLKHLLESICLMKW